MIMSQKFSGLAPTALHLLHRSGQCADDMFATLMGESNLTPRQFAVLKCAASTDDLSQTALVDLTGIDRSTLADIVRRLVQKGLLTRRRTRRDARMYAVRITVAGHEALKTAAKVADQTEARILAALPAEQRALFVSQLERIVTVLGPVASARVVGRKKPVEESGMTPVAFREAANGR
jgi:DNA-binding MarR family transcriptional regulator